MAFSTLLLHSLLIHTHNHSSHLAFNTNGATNGEREAKQPTNGKRAGQGRTGQERKGNGKGDTKKVYLILGSQNPSLAS